MNVPGPDDVAIALADRAGGYAQQRYGIGLPRLLMWLLRFDQFTWFAMFAIYGVTVDPILSIMFGLFGLRILYLDRMRMDQLEKDAAADWSEKVFQRYARAAQFERVRYWSRRTLLLVASLLLIAASFGQWVDEGSPLSTATSFLFWAGKYARYYGDTIMPAPPVFRRRPARAAIEAG